MRRREEKKLRTVLGVRSKGVVRCTKKIITSLKISMFLKFPNNKGSEKTRGTKDCSYGSERPPGNC